MNHYVKRRSWKILGVFIVVVLLGVTSEIVLHSGTPRTTSANTSDAQVTAYLSGGAGVQADLNVLGNVQQILVQKCMNNQGLIFYPSLLPAGSIKPSQGNFAMNYNLIQRETTGYNLYQSFVADANQTPSATNSPADVQQLGSGNYPPGDREDPYIRSLVGQQRSVYLLSLRGPVNTYKSFKVVGVGTISGPSTGCFAQAEIEVFGSLQNLFEATTGLSVVAYKANELVSNSAVYKNAMGMWSQCMATVGYHYSDPNEAVSALAAQYTKVGPTPALHALEIAVAVKDMHCAESVNLPRLIQSVTQRELNLMPMSMQGVMFRYVQLFDNAVVAGKSLLGTK